MSNMLLVSPITANSVAADGAGSANLLTPDPKEAWVSSAIAPAGVAAIALDFGRPVTVDTLFLGYTDLPSTAQIDLCAGASAQPTNVAGSAGVIAATIEHQHALLKLAAPITARYFQILIRPGAAAARTVLVGVVALGLAFQPQWNVEYGAGRTIGDTGSATRMFGGGFAIEEGVAFGGWAGTLSDLADGELQMLYAIQRRQKMTKSMLLAEDPAFTAGLSERLHWCLNARIEPYERREADLNRYGLAVQDWA